MNHELILSVSYFGPVNYFALIAKYNHIIFEQYENFPKQTHRNRCRIFGANGPIVLSIPVIRGRTHKVQMKDLKISYVMEWQKQHFKSIESAYRHSPFYEYYIDYFRDLYLKKHKYLWDFNILIFNKLIDAIELEVSHTFTQEFYQGEKNYTDFRYDNSIDENSENNPYNLHSYRQVFSDKFDFIPNLSILDLLFNMGPETLEYLEKAGL